MTEPVLLEVRERRSAFGRAVKWVFLAFQAAMVLLLLGTCAFVAPFLSNPDPEVAVGAGMFGAAGLLGLGAFGALTACLIALLATAIDHVWLAALIVALVYAAIAAVLALQGKKKIQQATPPAPQTIETVKEDVEWAKTRK